jgi:hypothetical protein
MGCTQIIDGRNRYWNIKGWGHFVMYFRLNRLHFLRFARYHFEHKAVPLWYHA